jgi:SSS family solute:Na+ symporter
VEVTHDAITWRTWYRTFLGINSEYTRGDRVLAWSVFLYSMLWGFGSFVVLTIWNAITPWPDTWWAEWFKIYNLVVPGIIAVVSTVWFSIGGTIDLKRLFKRLEEKEDNLLDDGRVVGHVTADNVAHVDDVENDK